MATSLVNFFYFIADRLKRELFQIFASSRSSTVATQIHCRGHVMQTLIMCGRTRGTTSIFINDNVTKKYTALWDQNKTFQNGIFSC